MASHMLYGRNLCLFRILPLDISSLSVVSIGFVNIFSGYASMGSGMLACVCFTSFL